MSINQITGLRRFVVAAAGLIAVALAGCGGGGGGDSTSVTSSTPTTPQERVLSVSTINAMTSNNSPLTGPGATVKQSPVGRLVSTTPVVWKPTQGEYELSLEFVGVTCASASAPCTITVALSKNRRAGVQRDGIYAFRQDGNYQLIDAATNAVVATVFARGCNFFTDDIQNTCQYRATFPSVRINIPADAAVGTEYVSQFYARQVQNPAIRSDVATIVVQGVDYTTTDVVANIDNIKQKVNAALVLYGVNGYGMAAQWLSRWVGQSDYYSDFPLTDVVVTAIDGKRDEHLDYIKEAARKRLTATQVFTGDISLKDLTWASTTTEFTTLGGLPKVEDEGWAFGGAMVQSVLDAAVTFDSSGNCYTARATKWKMRIADNYSFEYNDMFLAFGFGELASLEALGDARAFGTKSAWRDALAAGPVTWADKLDSSKECALPARVISRNPPAVLRGVPTRIFINGENLPSTTAFAVGTFICDNDYIRTASEVSQTCTAQPGSPNSVTIAVKDRKDGAYIPGGDHALSILVQDALSGRVNSVYPSTIYRGIGTWVTVYGDNLPSTAVFALDTVVCYGDYARSTTQISQTCVAQPGSSSSAGLIVKDGPNGTALKNGDHTLAVIVQSNTTATVTGIWPTSFVRGQPTWVTVYGDNLPSTTAFAIDTLVCNSDYVRSATQVSQTCTAQPGSVTNPGLVVKDRSGGEYLINGNHTYYAVVN